MLNKKFRKNFAALTLSSVAFLGMQTTSAGWIEWTSTTAGTIDIGQPNFLVTYDFNNSFTASVAGSTWPK